MRIAVTGASGLIGSALAPALRERGHAVLPMTRSAGAPGTISWRPKTGEIDARALQDVDAVVHLAGENIASGRWTDARKRAIRDSRVVGTNLLAKTIAGLERGPSVFVCASAVGFFGHRGDEILTEQSPPGEGFLPDVCVAWEAACDPARAAGLRVANLRFGILLSTDDGALKEMLLPFRFGVGGVLGSGRQYMSWITLADTVRVIVHALENDAVAGPVNVTAPRPVTNREFTKTLGRLISRPTLLPVPAFALRLLLGEMADALLLASIRVEPAALARTGFRFLHEDLETGLRFELGRGGPP